MPNRPERTLHGRRLTPSFGLLESLPNMQRERHGAIVVGDSHAGCEVASAVVPVPAMSAESLRYQTRESRRLDFCRGPVRLGAR
jgi:hypothetical protein